MKKFIPFILLITFCLVTASCSCSKKSAKFMLEGEYEIESYRELATKQDLETKIENEDNFILYIYSSTCVSCQQFTPKLIDFIKENDVVVYAIESYKISASITPTLRFYKDGKSVKSTNPDKDRSAFKSADGLKKFVAKHAYLPQIFEVNETQFDTLISSNEEFTIYIKSASCGDCRHFNLNTLNPYLIKNTITKKFYTIDVDKFLSRNDGDGNNTQQWIDFKNKYGLSNVNNTEFGYKTGVVPTVQTYKNGQIVDMLVYLNDTLTTDSDGSYLVGEGYYGNDTEIVGKTFEDYQAYQDGVWSFYNQKFIEYVEKNVK